MSWTNEVVLEFIELYRAEQHLWDNNHHLHRTMSEVTDGWNRIRNALSIDCTVECLKKKKESLMTSFRMHCKRKKSQPSYRTNWFAYNLMESFLSSKYECDSTNVIESEYPSYNTLITEQDNRKSFDRNSSMTRRRSSQQDADKKYRLNDHKSDILFARKQMNDVTSFQRASSEKRDLDEYELYGQLLVKKLKKLDERQRYVAMHEIDSIMFRAKMKSLQGDAHTARSYSNSPVSRKIHSPVFVSLDNQYNQPQYDPTSIQYEEQS